MIFSNKDKFTTPPPVWAWALAILIPLASYLVGLNYSQIPTIGDEGVYIQMSRATSETGRWLPLVWDQGVFNTKPPLLFWQGMVTADFESSPSLWSLRWPSVIYSFLSALLIFWLVFRHTNELWRGFLSGVIFLSFISTYKHGRPFLMQSAEMFLVFFPTALYLLRRKLDFIWTLSAAIALGLAALYKSFFLIAVGALAAAVVIFHQNRWNKKWFTSNALPQGVAVVSGALALFSVWLMVDPDPKGVLAEFFMKENAGKFQAHQFWSGFFSGPYNVFRIWLGAFANAGFLALPLLGLVIFTVKNLRRLSRLEVSLWLFVFMLLAIYTLPTQRQENYILPAMLPVALLLGLRWQSISYFWFRSSFLLITIFSALAFYVVHGINNSLHSELFAWPLTTTLATTTVLGLSGLFLKRDLRSALPFATLLFLMGVSLFGAPFSAPYDPAVQNQLKDKEVFFPSTFNADYEYYFFKAPGARVKGYRSQPGQSLKDVGRELIMQGRVVAFREDLVDENPGTVIAKTPYLKQRLTENEISEILYHGKFENLVGHLTIRKK